MWTVDVNVNVNTVPSPRTPGDGPRRQVQRLQAIDDVCGRSRPHVREGGGALHPQQTSGDSVGGVSIVSVQEMHNVCPGNGGGRPGFASWKGGNHAML